MSSELLRLLLSPGVQLLPYILLFNTVKRVVVNARRSDVIRTCDHNAFCSCLLYSRPTQAMLRIPKVVRIQITVHLLSIECSHLEITHGLHELFRAHIGETLILEVNSVAHA